MNPTDGSSKAQFTVQLSSLAPPLTEKLTPQVPSGRGDSGGMSTLHGSSPSAPILQPSRWWPLQPATTFAPIEPSTCPRAVSIVFVAYSYGALPVPPNVIRPDWRPHRMWSAAAFVWVWTLAASTLKRSEQDASAWKRVTGLSLRSNDELE